MRRSTPRGFTLIEAMVVVALVGVLLTLALPSFSKRLVHHRLLSTAETLAQDITEARHQSAKSGLALHLNFSGNEALWCYAVARSSGCGCVGVESCQLKTVRSSDLPGIRLSNARDMRFDPAATETAGGGADVTSTDGETLRVGLSPLGRARICAPVAVPGSGGYAAC